MAKIENTTVYPLVTPNASDYVIGTDSSDDNRTVSFSIADITAAGGLQDLQSVLTTGDTATEDINLTGNITVIGTVYPTTITAAGTAGLAGQILSSTGTGLQWINAAAAQDLQSVLTAGNTTTLDIITSGNITSTGNITMNGAAQTLALSNGVDMTLAVNSDITTSGNINLSGASSVLNFGTAAAINDSAGSTGTTGQIITLNGAGEIIWNTGIPTQSMPTLQQVLTAGNTATGIGMAFTGAAATTFAAAATINSAAPNIWSGTNSFTANGTLINTAGIALSGSLWDGASTGTASQVLTSTATGVAWADLSTVGVASVNSTTPIASANPLSPITIIPTTGLVLVRQNIYNGGSLIGCVPDGGTAGTFLQGDGTWAAPAGGVTSVSAGVPAASTGTPLTITPTTGAVVATSNAYAGTTNVGHVPTGGSATTFLRGDGTWVTPTGAPPEYNKYLKFANAKWTVGAAGDYLINPGAADTNFGQSTACFAQSHGASAPDTVALTAAQLAENIIAANTTAGCSTFYPNMQTCRISYQWFTDQAATYTFEVWQLPRSGGLATAGVAATATVAAAASNLYTGDLTITAGPVSILNNNQVYILTVRSNATMTNMKASLGLTLKFQGVA